MGYDTVLIGTLLPKLPGQIPASTSQYSEKGGRMEILRSLEAQSSSEMLQIRASRARRL